MFVTSGAAFQFASPAWLATTDTLPAPVNARFVPPVIVPGPLPTSNETASPLVAVAASPTSSVVANTLPFVGRKSVIVWSCGPELV